MAKGIQDFTVQESNSPYIKAVVATTSDQDPSRGFYVIAGGAYTLTVDNADVVFTGLITGHVYPISITKSSSANVILLY